MVQMLDITGLAGEGKTRVLSGKQRGMQARVDYRLDAMDRTEEEVQVVLSPTLDAITPSFVLGMFGPSVRRSGSVDTFFGKYRFNAKPHLMAQLRRGAEYSLVRGNPLPS
jgi:hypothetical protein